MKNKRLYSYFEKENGKWVRKSARAYTLRVARLVFQNWLLMGSVAGKNPSLRVVQGV